jgi:hypothetical protein
VGIFLATQDALASQALAQFLPSYELDDAKTTINDPYLGWTVTQHMPILEIQPRENLPPQATRQRQ